MSDLFVKTALSEEYDMPRREYIVCLVTVTRSGTQIVTAERCPQNIRVAPLLWLEFLNDLREKHRQALLDYGVDYLKHQLDTTMDVIGEQTFEVKLQTGVLRTDPAPPPLSTRHPALLS